MTQLALVIDLNVCVGCHACVTSCKEWNAGGIAGPLTDERPYGKDPQGVWFNRVHSYEVAPQDEQPAMTLHFPRSCLHCETPACVTVCPTGASYKRYQDGIVLVDYDKCIGCKYCSWACPYGMREVDEHQKVMKKCTLCVDRVYDENLPPADQKQLGSVIGLLPILIFLGIAVGLAAVIMIATLVVGAILWKVIPTFAALFAARIVVGLGEAVLSPAAVSLISDYFPPDKRGRAVGDAGRVSGGDASVLVEHRLQLPEIGERRAGAAVFVLRKRCRFVLAAGDFERHHFLCEPS